MTRTAALLATIAATAASLLAITVTPASAATPDQLPGLGYAVNELNLGVINGTSCHSWSATGYGATGNFGSDCDPGFQQALDSFVAGHDERKLGYEHPAAVAARASLTGKGYQVATDYASPTFHVTGGCGIDSTVDSAGIAALDSSLPTAAPCPTVPAPTVPAATTPTATTPAPTTPTATTPTATTTAPTATTGATSPTAAPATPADTTAAPSATQAAPAAPDALAALEARVTALEAQIAALTSRVDRLEKASDAAWLAYQQAILSGYTADQAADIARGTALNVIYGLGAYAA